MTNRDCDVVWDDDLSCFVCNSCGGVSEEKDVEVCMCEISTRDFWETEGGHYGSEGF